VQFIPFAQMTTRDFSQSTHRELQVCAIPVTIPVQENEEELIMVLAKPKKNAKFDAVGLGYNSIDHLCILPKYPEIGSKSKMFDYSIQGGGQTATACAALATLGFSASYMGKFGAGDSGRMAEDSLKNLGVDTKSCLYTDAGPNQISVIWIDAESGERTIANTRGPELGLKPEELNREAVCSGRVLLLDAHDIPAMIQAAKWAHEADIPTVLDAERILPGIEELLELTDYVITDQHFPTKFTGLDNLEEALQAMSSFGPFVAATVGDGGVAALIEGRLVRVPAISIDAVDSTGAGDVFHGAFAAGLLLDMSIEQVLRFANVTAGLSCCKIGGRAGIPDREKALKLWSTFQ
jgi:sulfofructose kinase